MTPGLLACVLAVLTLSCGQSSPSASITPSPGSNRPAGGQVPAQLLGDWFLSASVVTAVIGDSSCTLLKLTLAPTTYRLTHTDKPICGTSSVGEVVVNKTEIDFFNADACGLQLPDGVGRYTWTMTPGVLSFSPLNQDPCPRGAAWLANRSYSRTSP